MPDVGHVLTWLITWPGLAVFRYSCAVGCEVTEPLDRHAQDSCVLRQGLLLVDRPPFTPMIAKARLLGSDSPHCG